MSRDRSRTRAGVACDGREDRARDDLWAITCYFNPVGFPQRRINYEIFRLNLDLPLLTVELSFDGVFKLGAGDADELIQLQGGSVLWQKERLLNIAEAALPETCRYVAWLDCDVIFGDDRWPVRARQALERANVVQLFSWATDLPRGCRVPPPGASHACDRVASTMYAAERGQDVARGLACLAHRSDRSTANGLAWAARREFFAAAGLYDACVLGSGDRALACAILGVPEVLTAALELHPWHAAHYLSWARRVSDWVEGAYSALPGEIYHLWHGPPDRRLLSTRYAGLHEFQFDPLQDIELDAHRVWRWATCKRAMHEYVESYFLQRMEDG